MNGANEIRGPVNLVGEVRVGNVRREESHPSAMRRPGEASGVGPPGRQLFLDSHSPAASQALHILHLEDSAADAEWIQGLVCSHWENCEITTLTTREAFETAVRSGDFDLILSDYSLPRYSGPHALALVRACRPDKPFIYLSGTIGEERAIEALKSGATDYVLKDRPARLIPAIGAALAAVRQAEARRRAEEKIREQASLLDKSREAICVTDAEGFVTYWNASAERLSGWRAAEALGRDLREMLYADDPAPFNIARALTIAEGEWRGELRPRSRSGQCVLVESFWSLVMDEAGDTKSILIVEADVTEKRKIETHLLQTQRLETLGLLVGGIAHDLNNMLAPILTSVDLLRERAGHPHDGELLEIMDVSAHHGIDLVRQLLAFARGDGGQRGELAVDALIGSVRRLLHSALPPGVEIRTSLESELWSVHADATQLRQVLLNLCLNARDAMPHGGTIEIRARDVEVDAATASAQGEVKPGPYVCISVADTGVGIPPGIVEKIFDPFFTTKQIGKGTGLGLANVAGIVKSHGGFLSLQSEPAVGTTFHVHLPASVCERVGETTVVAPHQPMHGHGEKVLVIEDDEGIRTVLDIILSTRGYRVTMAADGREGLELARLQPDAFSLVMTDLNLPDISGAEVIQNLRALPVSPKLVVLSGSPGEWHEDYPALSDIKFLRKPLTVESLLSGLRQVLDTPSAEASETVQGPAAGPSVNS